MSAKRIRHLASVLLAGIALFAWAQAPQAKEDPKARLAKAEAMFVERCKKAGVFIHRTAENVEGILLMKLRPGDINYDDQYRLDDPYGRDVGGNGYIENFLLGRDAKGSITPKGFARKGYRYVEAIDSSDGKRYRYTGSMKVVSKADINAPAVKLSLQINPNYDFNNYAFVLDKVPAPGPAPRYGVTYDDVSTREERDYWIAGSSLKVIDLQTNEIMAERVGYMMDRGQGNTGGGRSPWLLAARNACPSFPSTSDGRPFKMDQSRDFVEKILKPVQEK